MAISQEGDNGEQQVIHYDAGVGSDGRFFDRMMGGGFGHGLGHNIRELYTFLCVNYDPGDEIYMFGFSRGAYTVRSLAGMINAVGLCHRDHIQFVHEGYQLYRSTHQDVVKQRDDFKCLHGDTVPITAITCFDTVGSLGIPTNGPLGRISSRKYRFHDTTLGANVQNAVHLLAIDETKRIMKPTLMKPNPDVGAKQLTQRFMWGHHSGIGGGNKQEEVCANLALEAAIRELSNRGLKLKLNPTSLPRTLPSAAVDTPVEQPRQNPLYALLGLLTGKYIRHVEGVWEMEDSAIHRFQSVPDWRPDALNSLADKITDFVFGADKKNSDGK